jgi:hypothetical protein
MYVLIEPNRKRIHKESNCGGFNYTNAKRISHLIRIDVVEHIGPWITRLQPRAITKKFHTILDGDGLSPNFLQAFHKLCLCGIHPKC